MHPPVLVVGLVEPGDVHYGLFFVMNLPIVFIELLRQFGGQPVLQNVSLEGVAQEGADATVLGVVLHYREDRRVLDTRVLLYVF